MGAYPEGRPVKMGTEVRVMQPPREARKRRQEGTLSDGETPGAAWPFQPLDLGLLASRPWRTHSVAASPSFVVLWYKSLRELKPHVPQLFLGCGSLGRQLPASELQFPELGITTSTPCRRCKGRVSHTRWRGPLGLSLRWGPTLGLA